MFQKLLSIPLNPFLIFDDLFFILLTFALNIRIFKSALENTVIFFQTRIQRFELLRSTLQVQIIPFGLILCLLNLLLQPFLPFQTHLLQMKFLLDHKLNTVFKLHTLPFLLSVSHSLPTFLLLRFVVYNFLDNLLTLIVIRLAAPMEPILLSRVQIYSLQGPVLISKSLLSFWLFVYAFLAQVKFLSWVSLFFQDLLEFCCEITWYLTLVFSLLLYFHISLFLKLQISFIPFPLNLKSLIQFIPFNTFKPLMHLLSLLIQVFCLRVFFWFSFFYFLGNFLTLFRHRNLFQIDL